ncbi:hypothetical protein [Planctomyces sp. SH-PL62]|uniref:hypothetical protein n=1 Tax=Planctomyces sp. SH-PL62 TaxID=1636152 RepID=UPI00078E062E|nr:hypothetical protein [Planctomyces sp. SH-PL62]AMV38532.1 hypothetical protein VT85_13935 [Planctomyces sp. SH-PL62]
MPPLSMAEVEIDPAVRCSLQERAELEALRFKWIESEKAGHDLGEAAIRLWIGRFWNRFLRQHWLEHLAGDVHWIEFDARTFAILRRPGLVDSPLAETIVERFRWGEENLHIIQWAMDVGQPMEEVRAILTLLDVNSSRLSCQFDPARPRYRHAAG